MYQQLQARPFYFFRNWQADFKIYMEMQITCINQNEVEKERSWKIYTIWVQDLLETV